MPPPPPSVPFLYFPCSFPSSFSLPCHNIGLWCLYREKHRNHIRRALLSIPWSDIYIFQSVAAFQIVVKYISLIAHRRSIASIYIPAAVPFCSQLNHVKSKQRISKVTTADRVGRRLCRNAGLHEFARRPPTRVPSPASRYFIIKILILRSARHPPQHLN